MYIVLVYFIMVLALGWLVSRNTRDCGDLFLAGKRLGWVSVGLSLFMTNISSTTLIGLSGAAYSWGIAVANYEWMAAVVLVFFAIYFVPAYLHSGVITMP